MKVLTYSDFRPVTGWVRTSGCGKSHGFVLVNGEVTLEEDRETGVHSAAPAPRRHVTPLTVSGLPGRAVAR